MTPSDWLHNPQQIKNQQHSKRSAASPQLAAATTAQRGTPKGVTPDAALFCCISRLLQHVQHAVAAS
jgi:hypothetical protein